MKKTKNYKLLLGVALAILILDQITKQWVIRSFFLGESVSILPSFFNLTYIRNTGAAFGIFATAHPAFRVPFFFVVPIIALISIAYVFRKVPPEDTKMSVALSLVMGGAVGNLIDRVVYGYVIDFLDFHWDRAYHFPAFNVADSAICVGVGLLMLDLLKHKPAEESARSSHASNTH